MTVWGRLGPVGYCWGLTSGITYTIQFNNKQQKIAALAVFTIAKESIGKKIHQTYKENIQIVWVKTMDDSRSSLHENQ